MLNRLQAQQKYLNRFKSNYPVKNRVGDDTRYIEDSSSVWTGVSKMQRLERVPCFCPISAVDSILHDVGQTERQ
jgi:hypothetical protein